MVGAEQVGDSPFPDWELMRMTSSYVRPMSPGSMGRYGTSHGASPGLTPDAAARSVCRAMPLAMASWWVPENAVCTRSPP